MLDRDYEKINHDTNFISCRRNELGLSAATITIAEHVLTTMAEANLLSSASSKWAAFPIMGWLTPRMSRTARKKTKGVEQGGRPANFRHPSRTVLR